MKKDSKKKTKKKNKEEFDYRMVQENDVFDTTLTFFTTGVKISSDSLCLKFDDAPIYFEKVERICFEIGDKKYCYKKVDENEN